MTFDELYKRAKAVIDPRQLTDYVEVGGVGAAVYTNSGNIYVGVCIDTASSMGFCAEHGAISAMITAGESHILKLIAVGWDGKIMPPCGRCRELISQINNNNYKTEVMVAENVIVKISDLLPYDWKYINK